MLAAASSFFGRSAISQSYNIGSASSGSRTSTPSVASSSTSSPPMAFSPSVNVGLWKVQSAYHKVTSKRVSVWSLDKKHPEIDRLSAVAKEGALDVLKAEASALGRLRHPSILEMVEPLEETRGELIFATEPLLSSLELSIPGSKRNSCLVELDEVEIQKGILQICKGLLFLHSSAKLIHSNIRPESIVINTAGDWKIAGLGLTIPLVQDGAPTRWEFPTYDGRAPSYIQRSFDYMAPEYALDELLDTASDMYSLGCLIYAVHCKGNPPFQTHGSLGALRENAGRPPPNMERLDSDLQALLKLLVTRHANNRPTPTTLPTHSFFSSLPISTLNFLDRSNFTSKTREEKISFMKGLTTVLDRFSEGLRTRKILPSLLEEMKDTHILPYILPNIFSISTALSSSQFANLVLPSLRPLFAVKEPPQNMLTLLENLPMLQSKTDQRVFREQVLPLVYNALESQHAVVQERALKAVPDLCETIDYAEVQGVLFPRVESVFTKTRILSVKVASLTTFLTMVKTLDQTSLTQKLVPLLSKIRTKEPAVTMATLSVQEAMGFKVDREAVATLVLPQLWAMSIGPLLNLEQFQRFMDVIRKLGDRVEKEHNQFLRDSQRIGGRSTGANGPEGSKSIATNLNFESLVGGANGATATKAENTAAMAKGWDEDWESMFTSDEGTAPPSLPVVASAPRNQVSSLPSSPKSPHFPTVLPSIRPPLGNPIPANTMHPPQSAAAIVQHVQPKVPASFSRTVPTPPIIQNQPPKPNYNISLPPTIPLPSQLNFHAALTPHNLQSTTPPAAVVAPPPLMGSLLAPSRPTQPSWPSNTSKQVTKDDWGDFDPLA